MKQLYAVVVVVEVDKAVEIPFIGAKIIRLIIRK